MLLEMCYNQRVMKHAFILITSAFAVMLSFSSAAFAADKEGDPPKESGKRDSPEAAAAKGPADPNKSAAAKNNSKSAKVFAAYDADDDKAVTDEEIVTMMEAKQNSRGRREVRKAVKRADTNDDGKLDSNEFVWWYTVGRLDEDAKNGG